MEIGHWYQNEWCVVSPILMCAAAAAFKIGVLTYCVFNLWLLDRWRGLIHPMAFCSSQSAAWEA